MVASDFDTETQQIVPLLHDLFEVSAVYRQSHNYVFSLSSRYEHARSVKLLKDRLKLAGYRFTLDDSGDIVLLTIDPHPRLGIPTLNIVLFILTLFTIYIVPVFYRNLDTPDLATAFRHTLDDLARGTGIEFTLALISILFVHEMGHFIASRRRRIITSWPYFIPAPNIIGTFGAIIKSKSPFWNRRDLIEVGASGPVAGWIVAVLWLVYGLSQSTIVPPQVFGPGEMAFSMDGESILMKLLTLNFIGQAPAGYFYRLTEAAFAGWVGLLVTAINLLPIGQLDGGHILYGLTRRRQHILGKIAMGGLVILGFQSSVWWFFAVFGLIFGVKHPPTLDDTQRPSRASLTLAVAAIIIMFLSFTPVPFR